MLHEVNRVGLVFGHSGGLGGTEVDGQLNDQKVLFRFVTSLAYLVLASSLALW